MWNYVLTPTGGSKKYSRATLDKDWDKPRVENVTVPSSATIASVCRTIMVVLVGSDEAFSLASTFHGYKLLLKLVTGSPCLIFVTKNYFSTVNSLVKRKNLGL